MGPQIETGRLKLRLPEMDDAARLCELAGDYDVARMTGSIPHPYPQLAAEMWVLINRARWTPQGNQSLVVTDSEGALVGSGGVFRRRPEADWELGYWIGRPWWGRGYATEIGRALIDFSCATLGATRLVAGHYHDNPASGRVLEKLGFRYTGKTENLFCTARMKRERSIDMVWEAA